MKRLFKNISKFIIESLSIYGEALTNRDESSHK
jgi:hypothetical protein